MKNTKLLLKKDLDSQEIKKYNHLANLLRNKPKVFFIGLEKFLNLDSPIASDLRIYSVFLINHFKILEPNLIIYIFKKQAKFTSIGYAILATENFLVHNKINFIKRIHSFAEKKE